MGREFEELLKDVLRELKDLTVILKSTSKAAKQTATDQRQNQTFLRQNIVKLKEEVKQRKKSGEAFDKLEQELEDSTDALKGLEKQAKNTGGVFTSLPTKFKNAIGQMITNVAKTALMFSDVSRPVDNLTEVTEQLSEGMGIAQKVAVRFANNFDTVRGAFVNLAKSGASFNGDLLALSRSAAEANIPLPKFTAFLQANASTFGNFFGTVQGGANEFIKLARGLKQITEKELAQFGLTTDETQEFLATFLEQERRRGNLQNFTATQLTANTVHYTKTLAKLSALTGKSVDVLDEQNKAAMGDALFRASMADMDPKAASVLSTAFGDAGPGVQQLIKDIKTFGQPVNEFSRQIAVAAPELIQATRNLINNQGDDDALRQFNNALGAAGERLTGDQGKGLLQAAVATGQFTDLFTELVPRVRAQVSEGGLADTLEQLSTSGQKAVNVFSQFDTLSSKLQDVEIQASLPATLAAAGALGEGFNLLSADDGPLDKFRQAIMDVTAAIKNLISTFKFSDLGTEKGTGKGTILSTADDSMFGMARRGGERLAEGGQGNSIYDILTPFDTLAEQLAKAKRMRSNDLGSGSIPYYNGSDGFQNFGSGTPATLHGIEAVVPKNDYGQLAKVIEQMTGNTGATTPTGADMQSGNTGVTPPASTDMQSANTERYLRELVELNKNAQRALNTLVTIGAMTEKNTKNTNNNVANMGGSLV